MYHLEDLESDFSRFHRVDNIWAIDGPRFMRMAMRLEAYGGVMTMRRQMVIEENWADTTPSRRQAQATDQADDVSLAEMMLIAPGVIDFREVGD